MKIYLNKLSTCVYKSLEIWNKYKQRKRTGKSYATFYEDICRSNHAKDTFLFLNRKLSYFEDAYGSGKGLKNARFK